VVETHQLVVLLSALKAFFDDYLQSL